MKSFKELVVWQKSMDLVEAVYAATRTFPNDERFGLISQMRRAAVSIPSNIAEGHGRNSDGAFGNFLRIAMGSLRELETQLLLSQRLGMIDHPTSGDLLSKCDEIGRMLRSLATRVTASKSKELSTTSFS